MTTINLKDLYYWYTQDQLIEVSDEVAEVFKADARYEMAYQRRLSRHKAQYSLDCDDGIEYSACLHEPTPQELLERMETFLRLWNALNSLPEIQGRRIDAHILNAAWGTMPLKDAIDFAEFLVDTTIKYERFSDDIQTCGGDVDVLVITKDEAFWKQHKIYNPKGNI